MIRIHADLDGGSVELGADDYTSAMRQLAAIAPHLPSATWYAFESEDRHPQPVDNPVEAGDP